MSEQTVAEQPAVKFGFRTSTDIGEIAAALVAAQAKFGAAIKDSQNPAYRSKYADLSAVIEATQKPLNDAGIAVLQAPQLEGQMVTVTTRLQHKSGQWYESDLTLPAVQRDRFDAQSVGSAITYARRYSLQAITGLATEDDDGNAASGIGSKDASKAVGERKKQEATERQGAKKDVSVLFYTYPESHNGHAAQWLNISEFAAANEDKADSLRMVFTAHKARKTADGGALVPFAEMGPLMEKLAGDLGLTVKELKGA